MNYLYVIAANACKDYHRKRKELLLEDLPKIPDEKIDGIENTIMITEALDTLSEELRETAVLFFIQERRQKDIAAILGIGVSLVKYRIQRARELLSEYLGKENI